MPTVSSCLGWKWGIIPLIPWFPDPKLNFLEMQSKLAIFPLLFFRNPIAKHTKAETWVVFWFSFIFALSGFKCNRIYTKTVNVYTHTVYNVYAEQRNHCPDSAGGDQDPVLREAHKETNQNKQVEKQKDRHRVGKKPLAYILTVVNTLSMAVNLYIYTMWCILKSLP